MITAELVWLVGKIVSKMTVTCRVRRWTPTHHMIYCANKYAASNKPNRNVATNGLTITCNRCATPKVKMKM